MTRSILTLAALSLTLISCGAHRADLAADELPEDYGYDAAGVDESGPQPTIAEVGGEQAQAPKDKAPVASADAPRAQEEAESLDDALAMDMDREMSAPMESIATSESKVRATSARQAPAKKAEGRSTLSRGDVAGAVAMPATAVATGGSTMGMGGMSTLGYVAAPPPQPEPVPEMSNSEDYTDYGVNPFTMVSKDPLSTFSIDVDTASYTVARRKLNEGTLPPWESVRVEEFVNYFDYGYRTPTSDKFAVDMEAMPDPFRAGHHILRVGVQGMEYTAATRPPLHVTFLVDVSGSMSSGDKLALVKHSLHMLVDSLGEDDTVGLATYAGRTARILEPTSAVHKRTIHDAIESLSSGGSTAMSSGLDIAYEMAWEEFEKGAENRVIVLSDGDANVGNTSWEVMLSNIKGYADKGVTLSTVGYGMGNYQDTLMEQLANKGDGNNFYIDTKDQAQRVFVEEIGGTLFTIARDVKIQVEFNEDSVLSYRLIGYENRDIADRDFRNDRVDAGEVGSGTNVTALYDVILRDGYTRDLATVRMRWEEPGEDKEATERAFHFRDSALKETPWLASRSTRIAYSAATFAEILRQSPNAAEISLEELARFAEKSERQGEKDDAELVDLMRKASRHSS